MNTTFYIAKRYFFAKKSRNIINITSIISMFGILVSTAAMIIIMSGMNGIVNLIENIYGSFDPDIEITPTKGKTYSLKNFDFQEVKNIEGVAYAYPTIEEITMVKFADHFAFAHMKGVHYDFYEAGLIENKTIAGYDKPLTKESLSAIIGAGIQSQIQVGYEYPYNDLTVYGLLRTEKLKVNNKNAFKSEDIFVEGVFDINPEYNAKYLLVPYEFAANLLEYKGKATKAEIVLEDGADETMVISEIKKLLGPDFTVKTRKEKNQLIFKTNQTEKWMVFVILGFIMIISAFNMIASLTMLIIDKKKDIKTLIALGADDSMIKNIFILEGLLINFIGSFLGAVIGVLVCVGQLEFHWIKLENSYVDYWPVSIEWVDLLIIFLTIFTIGLASSILPVRYLIKKHFQALMQN